MNMSSSQEYQVTARKWRPAEFASVVGQEHVTQTLKNAIRQDRVHHAYLFSGPRGVGKTTTARILAKALNCTNLGPDIEPCGVCNSCREITEGRSMDVVEIDGASNNSVEDIRKLRDNAKYPPVTGRYKLYIIDDVVHLGSSNFDFRSLYLNLEIMLRIEDKTFADQMRGYVDGEIADSIRITPALHKKRATLWRRLKWTLSYWLVTTVDYTVTRRVNFGVE